MEEMVKVVVMTRKKKMEQCEREIPQLGPGELQIKSEYVGVCGSDLHFYSEGRLTNWVLDGPLVLRHELGGVVSTVGEGMTGFEIRDRMALELGVPRDHCEDCLKGHYNLYRPVRFMAIPGEKDGVFSEYYTHATNMTFRLPDNVPTTEGGFMEPLAVGMRACELSNTKLGETAAVLGAGCINPVTLIFLKVRGVSEIYAADVLDKYPEKAREPGATRVFNSRSENIEELVKALPEGGADQIYECAGNRITILQICRSIKRARETTLVDILLEPVLELNITTLNATEGAIYSVYRYRDLYPSATSAISKGPVLLKKIVSHTPGFKGVIEGAGYSLSHRGGVVRAVIRVQ